MSDGRKVVHDRGPRAERDDCDGSQTLIAMVSLSSTDSSSRALFRRRLRFKHGPHARFNV